jgi:hypothetical protein
VILGQQRAEPQELPTRWDIPADVWPLIQTIVDAHYPAQPKGHRRVELRRVRHGIMFRLRTGGPWHQRPQRWGDDRTGHRPFQPWCQRGLLARSGAVRGDSCDEVGGVDGAWQAADTAMGKARMGGDRVGRTPTDRGQKG